ncbi:hypothetical protein PQX77_004092 [Marasmius sp. AFHP31]|nr:hypothetical protein PQX77_004092 [Marasmius sp. AFHP31]
MRDTLKDANFPRTADLRVYHVGLRPGEVANRIVTVGSASRARTLAKFLDESPKPFEFESERGFLTITGRYKGTPVSIMSIGMGFPVMDMFVREARECVSGDMVIIRLGSCGCLIDAPVGTVVVPKSCVSVTRNVDFDFTDPDHCDEPPYRISKARRDIDFGPPIQAHGDAELLNQVKKSLEAIKPTDSEAPILTDVVNASADRWFLSRPLSFIPACSDRNTSFYSSQGRKTSFPDHNEGLIDKLLTIPDMATFEMETHHLYHLAACWGARDAKRKTAAPLTTSPVIPEDWKDSPSGQSGGTFKDPNVPLAASDTVIKVAAAQMVFAARSSRDFISPDEVKKLEHWTGQGVLDALIETSVSSDRHHPDKGSVWEIS